MVEERTNVPFLIIYRYRREPSTEQGAWQRDKCRLGNWVFSLLCRGRQLDRTVRTVVMLLIGLCQWLHFLLEWCLLYVWTDDTILTVHGEWVPHLYGNKLIKTHRIRMACMLWPDQHEVSYFYDKLLPSPSQAFCDVKSACNAFTWFLSFRFNSCFDKAAAGCLLDHWLFETIGMLSRVFSSCSNRIVIYKIVIFET